MKLTHASRKVVDFTTMSDTDSWTTINDVVMGGVSDSSFSVADSGIATFAGTVSLENNGGFASVRSNPLNLDLTGFSSFVLRIKGDGKQYKCSVRLNRQFDSVNYQATFSTSTSAWQEIRLPFSSFIPTFHGRILTDRPALDPAKIQTLGFLISDTQAGPFKLDIAWISAYK